MNVKKRHSKIIELVRSNIIETQEELTALLVSAGFNVTQSTVSRDIRELKLTKAPAADGKLCYSIRLSDEGKVREKLIKVFCEGVVSIDFAGNMVVIKTLVGLAMAVAASVDAMGFSEVIGSIAGDDVLVCIVKSQDIAVVLMNKLNAMLSGEIND
ncbi:MAG: arginine repressor [Clostridiales bacterium]|jgi:transcriptional regulator of arginine metabolism|nr:arginine repressor [Clostridiales bacterium]